MFGGLQVDHRQLAALLLGEEWQVSAGLDLQGGAQRQGQIRLSG